MVEFTSTGCGCIKKCASQFSLDHFRDTRAQCFDLSHTELDMVILGQLSAFTNTTNKVVVESGHLEKDRVKELYYILPWWQGSV